jgi:hypothetical protein
VVSVRLVQTLRTNLDRRNAELRAVSVRPSDDDPGGGAPPSLSRAARWRRPIFDGGLLLLWPIERRLPPEFPDLRAHTADVIRLEVEDDGIGLHGGRRRASAPV